MKGVPGSHATQAGNGDSELWAGHCGEGRDYAINDKKTEAVRDTRRWHNQRAYLYTEVSGTKNPRTCSELRRVSDVEQYGVGTLGRDTHTNAIPTHIGYSTMF